MGLKWKVVESKTKKLMRMTSQDWSVSRLRLTVGFGISSDLPKASKRIQELSRVCDQVPTVRRC